jgi:hypothetical protein
MGNIQNCDSYINISSSQNCKSYQMKSTDFRYSSFGTRIRRLKILVNVPMLKNDTVGSR